MQRAYDFPTVAPDFRGHDMSPPDSPLSRRLKRAEALRNERLARNAKAVAQ